MRLRRRGSRHPSCKCGLRRKLTGTVTNGTTKEANSAGDDVILIKLGQGMEEAGTGQERCSRQICLRHWMTRASSYPSSSSGRDLSPHGAAGTTTADVQVFDVSKIVPELSVTADVLRFRHKAITSGGARLFAVDNTSPPPRTQMNDQNFEFYLPEGRKSIPASPRPKVDRPWTPHPFPQTERTATPSFSRFRPGETPVPVDL